jgi:hypothetical protein
LEFFMNRQIARLPRHRRLRLPLLLATLLGLTLTASARADLIIVAESAVANAPSSNNNLEVILQNTGPGSVTIGAFSFGVSVTGTGINFTQADINTTTAPYIFNGNSLFGPSISTSTGPSLTASDADADPAGATLAAGSTVGLGRLFFDVSPSAAPGPHAVTIAPFPTTSLSDPFANDVPVTSFVDGQILVVSTLVVPEPAALWSAAVALVAGGCAWSRSRHRKVRLHRSGAAPEGEPARIGKS